VIAEGLREAIAESNVGLTASIGVATFPTTRGMRRSLFRAADAAMTSVKRGAKNGVGVR
jgi:GGDEF domain-containing protein